MVPIGWLILEQRYTEALILFFIAGASDGVDGFLAKHYGWTSRLGGILDPLADKLLLVSCLSVLTWNGLIPVWLLAMVIIRDVVIVAGATVYNFRIARFEAQPTFISKINTVAQILLVLLVMIVQAGQWTDDRWISGLIVIVAFTTIWSGVDYIRIWSRRVRLPR